MRAGPRTYVFRLHMLMRCEQGLEFRHPADVSFLTWVIALWLSKRMSLFLEIDTEEMPQK